MLQKLTLSTLESGKSKFVVWYFLICLLLVRLKKKNQKYFYYSFPYKSWESTYKNDLSQPNLSWIWLVLQATLDVQDKCFIQISLELKLALKYCQLYSYSTLKLKINFNCISLVQWLSGVWLFVTPWTAACQTSLSITSSWSLFKHLSIMSVMPSNHLILCCPLLLSPLTFPSIRVLLNESLLCIRWPKVSASASVLPKNIEFQGIYFHNYQHN